MRRWRLRMDVLTPACKLLVVAALALSAVGILKVYNKGEPIAKRYIEVESQPDTKILVNQRVLDAPEQHKPSFAGVAGKSVTSKRANKSAETCSFDFRREQMEYQCRTAPPPRGNSRFANLTQKQPGPALTSIVLDHERKIMGCLISKVSSTSWMHYLDKHTLVPDASRLRARLRRMRADALVVNKTFGVLVSDINTKYKDYKKYIIVKHPMQRLVSAYYETVVNRKMFNNITFDQFMEGIASREMVGLDEHWALYSWWCYPCDIKYDYILKMETFEHDLPLLNEVMGISKDAKLPDVNRNKYSSRSRNIVKVPKGLGHENLYRYEKELVDYSSSKPDVYKRAQQWYQPDMDMYGYSWDPVHRSSCGFINSEEKCC